MKAMEYKFVNLKTTVPNYDIFHAISYILLIHKAFDTQM
jgi:hypothetical protein